MKKMDHREYPKSLRSKSVESLLFNLEDAKAAMEAMPDGENAGYYADEVSYISMELRLRGVTNRRVEKEVV
jgi:hypothetical protein